MPWSPPPNTFEARSNGPDETRINLLVPDRFYLPGASRLGEYASSLGPCCRLDHFHSFHLGHRRSYVSCVPCFPMIANDRAELILDGTKTVTSPQPFAHVCGLADNAARPIRMGMALARGLHHLNVKEAHLTGVDDFKFVWRTPGCGTRFDGFSCSVPPFRICSDSLK